MLHNDSDRLKFTDCATSKTREKNPIILLIIPGIYDLKLSIVVSEKNFCKLDAERRKRRIKTLNPQKKWECVVDNCKSVALKLPKMVEKRKVTEKKNRENQIHLSRGFIYVQV